MLKKLKELASSMQGSVARAGIFAVAWAVCPHWLFFLVALYLFFVPIAQVKTVVVPFIILMGLTLLTPVGFYMAVIFGILFWYILLIKELYLVDRRMAYEILVLVLSFLIFRLFFAKAGGGFEGPVLLSAAFAAAVAASLFSSFISNFAGKGEGRSVRRVMIFVVFFIFLELLLTGVFLHLDFIYQTSVVFLLGALVMDLAARRLLEGGLQRTRVLVIGGTVFALLVIILGSARWGL